MLIVESIPTPVLVDTNIWIYALTDDTEKGEKARYVLNTLSSIVKKHRSSHSSLIVAPIQVVKELGRVLLDRFNFEEDEVIDIIRNFSSRVSLISESPQDVMTAIALRKRYKHIDYFDAIIIASALNHGIEVILSEDVPSPSRISIANKKVEIINPL
ncbi:MAG: PIN domain-containing protein [Aquificae bacterium]|nr:PIN domain-containing protein [Aquificota bacterium]